jgi:hypothetical protein
MKRLTTAVCITTALLATTALAQRDTSQQPGARPQPGTPGSSRESSIYGATGRANMHGTQVRATKAIGAQVKSSTGEDLGRIEDLLINPASGRAEFAVLNADNKLVPVPFRLLSCSTGTSTTETTPPGTLGTQTGMEQVTFTAQIDKDKLQSAPTISDRTRWSELQQPGFSQRIYAHYGVSSQGVGAPGSDIERGPGQGRKDTDDPQKGPGASPKSNN